MKKNLAVILAAVLLICAFPFAVNAALLPEEDKSDTVIKVTDNFNWGKAYAFARDEDGNEVFTAWPGKEIEDTEVNDYGENVFVITLPYNAVGVVINDGNGNQTENIMDFRECDGYWMDGSKDEEGRYMVTGYTIAPVDDTYPGWEETYYSFYNSLDFEDVYMYAYDNDGNPLLGEWPGVLLTEYQMVDGYEEYNLIIPYEAKGFVINDNKGHQTEDIEDSSVLKFFLDGTMNDEGHFVITQYNPQPATPSSPTAPASQPECTEPDYTYEIHFVNSENWENFYVYAWNDNGDSVYGEWPGTELTEKAYTNGYGQDVFTFYLPEKTNGFIVNNGKGEQSVDITDLQEYDYWLTGEKDDLGHYYVDAPYGILEPATNTDPTSSTVPNPGETLKPGDTNCDGIVSVADATLVQQHAAEMISLEGEALSAADTNGDGIVSVADATLIQQFAAEMIDKF